MKKSLFALGISLSLFSCDLINIFKDFKSGVADGVYGGCNGSFATIYLANSCDGVPTKMEITEKEKGRLTKIKENSTVDCVFVTVNPKDGSSSKEGYLKNVNILCGV
ncbi:hypothetical protein [Aestuariivivens sediminis]|uniref:hypothetical protein n=1 Tax=Aestuariivivens sediminis TaxID=2913557 RepID=UPI001F580D20|nr:hypothetical protein [Aestuariivivens sediminis]